LQARAASLPWGEEVSLAQPYVAQWKVSHDTWKRCFGLHLPLLQLESRSPLPGPQNRTVPTTQLCLCHLEWRTPASLRENPHRGLTYPITFSSRAWPHQDPCFPGDLCAGHLLCLLATHRSSCVLCLHNNLFIPLK
jgi:hypothetical protein